VTLPAIHPHAWKQCQRVIKNSPHPKKNVNLKRRKVPARNQTPKMVRSLQMYDRSFDGFISNSISIVAIFEGVCGHKQVNVE
jgi:hypothetical protein